MANPRKFSEKIALHNQRQAEETAEFERIMLEVTEATSNAGNHAGSSPSRQHLSVNTSLRTARATSLPNVNNAPAQQVRDGAGLPLGQNVSDMNSLQDQQHLQYRGDRPRSSLGPIRTRPAEKRIDTSPYGGAYLSPPSEWRRTHSDSSLHTSSLDPNSQRMARSDFSNINDGYQSPRRNLSASPDGRPRSVSDVPRVPIVSTYTSQPSSGAGSLPDLSNLPYSPAMPPLDYDDPTSPQLTSRSFCESPRSPSPNLINRVGRFNLKNISPQEAPGPPYITYASISPQAFQQSFVNSQVVAGLPQPLSPPNIHSSYGCPSPHMSPQSPPSPASHHNSLTDQNSYLITQAQNTLQHHFEQFTMSEDGSPQVRAQDVTPDTGYFSTSPSQLLSYNCGLQAQQSTPNTPSSIPDIIITNSYNTEDNNDLGVAMAAGSLDLFPTDECLRAGLDPIDFDGLQLLRDPDMIADPDTEDHLRLDGL